MPHDKNGTLLQVGDRVLIPAIVTAIQPGDDYCNATLAADPMPPYEKPYPLTMNTRQVVLQERVAVIGDAASVAAMSKALDAAIAGDAAPSAEAESAPPTPGRVMTMPDGSKTELEPGQFDAPTIRIAVKGSRGFSDPAYGLSGTEWGFNPGPGNDAEARFQAALADALARPADLVVLDYGHASDYHSEQDGKLVQFVVPNGYHLVLAADGSADGIAKNEPADTATVTA